MRFFSLLLLCAGCALHIPDPRTEVSHEENLDGYVVDDAPLRDFPSTPDHYRQAAVDSPEVYQLFLHPQARISPDEIRRRIECCLSALYGSKGRVDVYVCQSIVRCYTPTRQRKLYALGIVGDDRVVSLFVQPPYPTASMHDALCWAMRNWRRRFLPPIDRESVDPRLTVQTR